MVVSRNPPWSDLPQELLSAIANTLTSDHLCILTFRSVCRSWRSSCPPLSRPSILSPLLPLSTPRPPFPIRRQFGCSGLSFLSVTIIYALRRPLGSSEVGLLTLTPNTFILFVDEYNAGKVSVRKPFSRESYSVPINFPKNINLIDFSVHELGRFYSLSYSYTYDDQGYRLNKPRFCSENVDKVVLFPNGLAAITLLKDGKLGMIRLDVGINEAYQCEVSKWEIIHDGKGFRFDDIVEYKGRVLGIDRRGRVYEIGYHSSEMNPVVPPIGGGGGRRKRLAESLGLLYLVVRCNVDPVKRGRRTRGKVHELNERRGKTKFKVYELNEGRKKWVEISVLGDRSLFFGLDFSFSASARELGTCGKNCILFKNQSFRSYSGENDDDMLFSKLDGSDLYVGVCHLQDAVHFGAIESYPGYSDTLWSPPPWILSIDRSKRLGILETAIDEMLNRIPEELKTKEKEQSIEGVGDSSDDSRQQLVREAATVVLKLKNKVIRFQENEKELMVLDKKLQHVMSIHGLGDSSGMLNQIDSMLEQATTFSHGKTEERLGRPDRFQNAVEQLDTGHAPTSRMIRHVLRQHDALLFQLEELATEMEWFQKERLTPVVF